MSDYIFNMVKDFKSFNDWIKDHPEHQSGCSGAEYAAFLKAMGRAEDYANCVMTLNGPTGIPGNNNNIKYTPEEEKRLWEESRKIDERKRQELINSVKNKEE